MRFGLVLSVIALSLVLALPSLGAADAGPATVSAKAKACKGGKVAVTVGKRKACKPLAKAFPKPKAVDLRISYLTQALALRPARGAAGRAQRKLLRALPKVFARIDRAGKGKAGSSALAQASAACEAGVGGPSATVGGVTVSISGPNGGVLEVDSGGQRVKLRYGICGSSSFRIPECPTAAGDLDASYESSGEVVIEVWEGTSRLVSRSRVQFESKAKAKAKVGPDAKLRSVDLEYAHEVFVVASGGIVERGKSERKVRIEMPSGKYDAAGASVKVTGDASAVAKDGFERVAKEAIDGFERAEPRWSSFERKPHCAEPVFTPASNTLKLRKGQAGALGLAAKARTGGNATEARWTLLGQENAEFSPLSSEQAQPSVSYTVTNAPAKGFVRVTVKFTSTAGVGEGTWVQPTELGTVSQIEGTIGGETSQMSASGPPSVQKWSGTVRFGLLGEGIYMLGSGSVSIELSGTESSGVTGCLQSGSAQAPLASGTMNVTGGGPPFTYSIQLNMPFLVVKGTRHSCPSGAEAWEGTQFDTSPLWSLNVAGEQSPDGLGFTGSQTESFGGLTQERHWNLLGKP